LFRNLSTTTLY